jgi:hypothetical protein
MIYVFNISGDCLEINNSLPVPSREAFEANHGEGIVLVEQEDVGVEAQNLSLVDEKIVIAPAFAPPIPLYVHVSITGGDGDTPPGVVLGSGELLTINAAVRATADPASSLIEALNSDWRITIRNESGGAPDVVQVKMLGGQVVKRGDDTPGIEYDPPEVLGTYSISEKDFMVVSMGGQRYEFKLADPSTAQFKVYRVL